MKKLNPLGIIFLVFLMGVGFILYPSVGNLITLNTASVTIADYEKVVEELEPKADARMDKAKKFNEHLYYGTNEGDEDKCLNINDDVICYLDIPAIHVYLPVYYGTSDEVLKKGCGYVENTSLPVGGQNTNSVISGHTGLPGAELLSDLDKMKVKDIFYIHVLDNVLAYEVDTVKVVEPEKTEELEIVPGKDYVTLLTCTPYGINSHRLLVRGKRVPYVQEEPDSGSGPATVKSGLSDAVARQIFVIGAIILVMTAAVAAAVLYRRRILKQIPHKMGEENE